MHPVRCGTGLSSRKCTRNTAKLNAEYFGGTMKYISKCASSLAALGFISLAPGAQAEEKANVVQTALSSTTISGYVDTSAQWNFGTGNANVPPYRFNSPSK